MKEAVAKDRVHIDEPNLDDTPPPEVPIREAPDDMQDVLPMPDNHQGPVITEDIQPEIMSKYDDEVANADMFPQFQRRQER